MIENLEKQKLIINKLSMTKLGVFILKNNLSKLTNIVSFEKGFEIGSANYVENKVPNYSPFIRVGDLLNGKSVFVHEKTLKQTCDFKDILIAFDGDPGRNGYGFCGGYSSGLYKINCEEKHKGLVYFSVNTDINKRIICDYTKGTTILHASEAKNHLVYPEVSLKLLKEFNNYFNLLLNLQEKILSLKKVKEILLNRYFTNQ